MRIRRLKPENSAVLAKARRALLARVPREPRLKRSPATGPQAANPLERAGLVTGLVGETLQGPEPIIMPSWPPVSATLNYPTSLAQELPMH